MSRKSRDLRVKAGDVLTEHQASQIEKLEAECVALAKEANYWREECMRKRTHRRPKMIPRFVWVYFDSLLVKIRSM